jgi:GT2 family glycosyltransferase
MEKDLSVVIVSYNTKDLTLRCISALQDSLSKTSLKSEIIVIDNASQDGSYEELKKISTITAIHNPHNGGFGKANNIATLQAKGKYVLYLNSDVLVPSKPFLDKLIIQMENNTLVGVLTVRVNLPTGALDPASHRGFPTVWRSFCYFSRLEKITSHIPVLNRIFGGYHLTHLPLASQHLIDTPTGAFYLTRKSILDAVGGFDESFFMYGEDVDLSYRIKRLGYSVVFNPAYAVLHLKNQSGIKQKSDTDIQKKTRNYFYESMSIFYKKHYEQHYPSWISYLVYWAIRFKKNHI